MCLFLFSWLLRAQRFYLSTAGQRAALYYVKDKVGKLEVQFDPSFEESTSKTSLKFNSLGTQARGYPLPHHVPRKMTCGPFWATHCRRFIETQAFDENKVEFKSGADKPFHWTVMSNLQSNLGTSNKICATGGIHVKPLQQTRNTLPG